MKLLLALLLGAASAHAGDMVQAVSPNSGTITPDAITVKGSTFTVATTGIVSAPSQPSVGAYRTTTQSIPNNAFTEVYFDTDEYDNSNLHDVSDSSSTFTIPAGGGGVYATACMLKYGAGTGAWQVRVSVNGAHRLLGTGRLDSGNTMGGVATGDIKVAAGDVVKCIAYQNSGGALNVEAASAGSRENYFTMRKGLP